MKRLILLFIFIIYSIYSKADTIIVYIDVSDNPNKEEIIRQTKILIQNKNDEFIVFISNDNTPIIINNTDYLDTDLNKLFYISPSSPSIDDDTDTLNYYIDYIGIKTNSTKQISFYFYTTPTTKTNSLISRILLSNRLANSNGLKDNVNVNIIFDKNKETIETKKNYELFKIRKYEIKYY